MTTPEGRHETTDGSITAPCVCGEWHDLSFFLDAATRALRDVAQAAFDAYDRASEFDDNDVYSAMKDLRRALDAMSGDEWVGVNFDTSGLPPDARITAVTLVFDESTDDRSR